MKLTELQTAAKDELSRYKDAYGLHGQEFALAQVCKLTEEVGELANEVLLHFNLQRKEKLDRKERENLEREVGDVIVVAAMLGANLDINLERAVKGRLNAIKERG